MGKRSLDLAEAQSLAQGRLKPCVPANGKSRVCWPSGGRKDRRARIDNIQPMKRLFGSTNVPLLTVRSGHFRDNSLELKKA